MDKNGGEACMQAVINAFLASLPVSSITKPWAGIEARPRISTAGSTYLTLED